MYQDKKQIITRLFKDGHIDLDEVIILMQKEYYPTGTIAATQPGTLWQSPSITANPNVPHTLTVSH
jgi:hypothetical protein